MYKKLTEKEATELAKDIYSGLVFTDRHIQFKLDFPLIFMSFALMEDEDRQELVDNPPGMVYQYYANALPRTINGNPCFLSCQLLDHPSTELVWSKYETVKSAMAAIK